MPTERGPTQLPAPPRDTQRVRRLGWELALLLVLTIISRNPELVFTLGALALPELRRSWAHPLGRLLLRL